MIYNQTYKPNPNKFPVPSKEELRKVYKEFGTYTSTGRHYGVSRSTVQRWVYKYGLNMPGEMDK